MNYQEIFSDDKAQFALSYELLALLRWLVDNNSDALKKLIDHSVSAGLHEELKKIERADDPEFLHDIQHGITDFLTVMETLLIEVVSERIRKKKQYKHLIPALEKIDSTICDSATVNFSLEKATSKFEKNPKANPKELLFKELLRRWKSSDKMKN